MKNISLIRNIQWAFFGNIVYSLSQWGVLIVLAKLVSPDDLGQFSLAIAISVPVYTLTNLQLRSVIAADIRHSTSFADYFGLRVFSSGTALLVVFVLVLFFTNDLNAFLVGIIYGCAKYFDSLSDLMYGLAQKNERMDNISKSLIARGIGSLFLIFISVHITGSIIFGVVSYLFCWAIVYFFFDVKNSKKHDVITPSFNVYNMKQLFIFSLPLAIVVFLNAVSMNIPKYNISFSLGDSELGIFTAIASFMVVGSTLVGAVAQSTLPRLARYFLDDCRKYIQLLILCSALSLLVGLSGVFVAWYLGEPILRFVFTPQYAEHSALLVWVMLAAIPLYLANISGVGIAAIRRYRAQALVTAVATAIVLLSAILLIPEKGLVGGAMAIGFGFTFKWIGQVAIVTWMCRGYRKPAINV